MLLDRYILNEWLKVFLISVFVIFGLLILNEMQDDLGNLVDYGASGNEITTYYLLLIPSFMPVALPTAFMVSLLFALGQFHRNNEVIAMGAAGMSLFRITRSLWMAGVLLMIGLFQLNARLVPWSIEQSRELYNTFVFSQALRADTPVDDVGLLYNLTFHNRKDSRLWFINRFNEYNYRAYGITVSEIRPDDGEELKRIVANEGFYDDLRGQWTFQFGRETFFDPEGSGPVRSLPFDEQILAGFDEDPDLMKFLEKEAKDLSLRELGRVVNYLRPDDDPRLARYAVSYYDRIMSPVSCLIILGLAIPFSLTGVRNNPFVGVSKAMGLFLLYYLLLNVGQLAGTRGVPPFWAASIPNIAALLLVGWYALRLRRP